MNGMALWIGRGLTALFTLFMLGGSVAPKLANAKVAQDAMMQLGWDRHFNADDPDLQNAVGERLSATARRLRLGLES